MQKARYVETAEQSRQELGPSRVRELEHHARQSKREETEQHHQVQRALEGCEAPVEFLSRYWLVASPLTGCAPQPEEPSCGVKSGERQRPHQQGGHSPEGPEQERISTLVVVGRVRQITSKSSVRTRVTPGAGLYDIAPAERRLRFCRWQYVVRTMTVIALRRCSITQPRDFAVERLEEGLRLMSVAAAALVHHHQPEIRAIGSADRVRRVAVFTRGEILPIGLTHARPMDAVPKPLLDAVVTSATGVGNIVGVD